MDVASRCKRSYQSTTKNSKNVAQAFQLIYGNTLLSYPKTLIIDDGKEFYGETTKLMEKHDVIIQREIQANIDHKESRKDLIEHWQID